MSGESAPYGEEAGEEEREEENGEEEGMESLGLPYSGESPGSWASLELQEGAVIEALLEPLPGGVPRPVAVLGISARLGERHRELGRLFNVRGGRIHLCLTGRRLCEVHSEEGVVHIDELMLYPPLAYEGALCTVHGLRALKAFNAFTAKLGASEGPTAKAPAPKSSGRKRRPPPEENETTAAVPEPGLGASRLDDPVEGERKRKRKEREELVESPDKEKETEKEKEKADTKPKK